MTNQITAREFVRYAWSPEHPADLPAWREALAPLFDVEPLETPFRATLQSYALGEVLFSVTTGTAQSFVRDERVLTRGASDNLLIQMYSQGGFECEIAGRHHRADPWDLSCLDLGCAFTSVASVFSCYTLVIPRRMLAFIWADSPHSRLLPAGLARSRVCARHFETLAQLCPTSDAFDLEVLGTLTIALLKAALVWEEPEAAQSSPEDGSLFARIWRFVDANVTNPQLSAEVLGSEFGASRATLYRMFHRHGGVATFIRKRRLHRAIQELSNDVHNRERISSLAYRCGYRSEDTFARVFKERFGVGPAQWKRSISGLRDRE
ncbi:AraC family transcriptional regulator [Tsuneonella deserti]|uniref:AraC family transcriptional regulator n=1 Tax=Tsuneonella deserti TaxID=2035528 RepID=A0ABQ1SA98_9SPHN|nr:helix-turn-helix domain-containing protein [Tsuneonella deserti]GGE03531.1 AraC family transcriptional regulator [Tsuneonella deserti]